MTRRRPRLHLLGADACLLAGLAAGWQHEARPLGWAGLAAAAVLVLPCWPLLAVAVVYGLPGLAGGLVPCRWRMWHRDRREGRPHIPVLLRRAVYAADRDACLWCGDGWQLQLDHVRPWSCGGLNVLWNFVTLCGRCNRIKSNYWRYRSGLVVYRSWPGSADAAVAAQILAAERRARLNPARWLRAAWELR